LCRWIIIAKSCFARSGREKRGTFSTRWVIKPLSKAEVLALGRKWLAREGRTARQSELIESSFGASPTPIYRYYATLAEYWRAVRETPEGEPLPSPVQEIKDKSELDRLRSRVKELEAEALTSHGLKELIGTAKADQSSSPQWLTPKARRKGLTGIPFLMLSDIHFDEVVKAEQIGGVNEYNRDVATKRLQHTFNQSISLLTEHMADPVYEGFVLALGGDLLSGNIHEELAETNEASINQSLVVLSQILGDGIEKLAGKFGRVFVPCVVGNHGRLHKKPRMKNRVFDNFEWLIYQFLSFRFKGDSRVQFLIPEGSDAEFSIYNTRFLLTHGDQFRGGGGIGGIMVPIQRGLAKKQMRQAAIDRSFDVAVMGHWHQLVMLENTVINGSVKGYDEYAYQSNFGFEPPQQALFVVHPEFGITFRMPVRCDGYETKAQPAAALTVW
jgi:predicted phosphodiesterase